MKHTRRAFYDSPAFYFFFVMAVVFFLGCVAGNWIGFDSGVRAGIAGTWVIVQLPDGTEKIVEVKVKP